ncbi:lysoplasmalogenase [Cohnella xylanilytica]|uniref:Lysoplasmalogenase n=1 Tax=Cohnella xylanilytica TaxID=557555 RepID=A0A841TYM5_9BACL|nr:lysoplasmalogenase [Cohnella xylanilytica]MBB6690960.1 lysoplasmalogenase [Cohnella xylanilytica]
MDRKRMLLTAAIILSGAGYLLAMAEQNMTMRWILKPGTIVFIIGLALTLRNTAKAYRNLVIAGLLLSAAGDCFLLLDGSKWFVLGLSSFLLAHLTYIAAFATRWRGLSLYHLIALIPIATYSAWLLSELRKGIYTGGSTGLWLPVLAYVIVISAMILGAVISGSRVAMAGAVVFFVSDSLLAWNMFVSPIDGAEYAVMVTYYAAQFMIAKSIENHKHSTNSVRIYKKA